MLLADGVPAKVGMAVFILNEGVISQRTIDRFEKEGLVFVHRRPLGRYSSCRTAFAYSTRKAAEAGYRREGLL